MRLLITGVSGMLGHRLALLAAGQHEILGCYRSLRVKIAGVQTIDLGLEDAAQLTRVVQSWKPEVIIHTAAVTDVDRCERERDYARRINAEATSILAELAEDHGAKFIYISTDYVFDGQKGIYVESDVPNPISYYGESKLLGERAVTQECSKGLILRTSIFGRQVPPRVGLMESLLGALHSGRMLSRFADQYYSPIYTGDLSRIILNLLGSEANGLFHAGGARVSRLEFAEHVAEVFSFDRARFQPSCFTHIDGLAKRPKDSSLSSQKLEKLLNIRAPAAREGLMRLKTEEFETGREGDHRTQ